jgi:hypothetical protein
MTRALTTFAGIALAAFCGYELHVLLARGLPHGPLHDYLLAGVVAGMGLAFTDAIGALARALAPLVQAWRGRHDGGQ